VTPDGLLERLDAIENWERIVDAAYRRGWADGSRGQYERGRADAAADIKATWHQVVDRVRLTGRRLAPGGDIWLRSVLAHGGTEYGGQGRPRVPVDQAVIESAAETLKGRAA
jgi:hypothetical protein